MKCAWQESNLLPHAPQACALSGELQALRPPEVYGLRDQRVRLATAAAALWDSLPSRSVDTKAQLPKLPKKLVEVVSREEIQRMEDAAKTERDKLIVRVLADTGLRRRAARPAHQRPGRAEP